MSEDYYAVLGLERGASADDIRRAYKAIAKKDHPDRNPGDKEAEKRFKKANEAYAILSDDNKRREYDQWGSGGPQNGWPGGVDPFSNFNDIFSDIFGGGRRQPEPQRGPTKGNDIRLVQQISLRESMQGCSKEVVLELPVECDDCGGSGAKKGTSMKPCKDCNGTGQVMFKQGFMSIFHTCNRCGGAGIVVEIPCDTCGGSGREMKQKKMRIDVPAGISHGQQLRVGGFGLPGNLGGPPGDAYVAIDVANMEGWQREDNDLLTLATVSFPVVALGGEIDIEMPDGEMISVEIPSGSQPNSEVVVRGKGMPLLRKKELRGDLRVILNVRVPQNLSNHARSLLESLDKELR